MTLTYIYHSCYVAEGDQAIVVFDYWKDPEGRLHEILGNTSKQVYFLVSHFHEDHYNADIFAWEIPNGPAPRHIISYDTKKRRQVNPSLCDAILHPGEHYDDDILHITAYRSTDVGVSYFLEWEDSTLFHAGDLNNWYFDEPDEHLKVTPNEMEGLYLSVLRDLKRDHSHITHVMLPIDPRLKRHILRGPFQWLTYIHTEHLYPMHTWEEDISSQIQVLHENFPELEIHSL